MLMIAGRGGYNGRNETEMRRGGEMNYREPDYSRMGYGGAQGAYSGMNNRSNYARSEYEAGDMEARFRDRRGREHYDNGRFAPMRSDMYGMEDAYGRGRNIPIRSEMDETESRRYRRYSDGRFAPRSEHGGGEMAYPTSPFVPPIYERGERSMNPIGFVPGGYSTYATHKQGDEMEHRTSKMERGGASSYGQSLTQEMAEEWMSGLENEDGSTGPHWSIDQVKQVMSQHKIEKDPYEFAAVLNSIYSDYSKVLQKHNVNKIDMYVDLACAWLRDKDAVPDKAGAYFMYVVK